MSEATASRAPTLHLRVHWKCSASGSSSWLSTTWMESLDTALDETLARSPCDIAIAYREESL